MSPHDSENTTMTDDREAAHVMALNGHIGAVSVFNRSMDCVCNDGLFEAFLELR
jgi:hypothetical protein